MRTAPGKGATFRIALPLAPEAQGGGAADDDPDLDEAGEAPDLAPGPAPEPVGGVADGAAAPDGTAPPAGGGTVAEAGEDVVTFGGKPAGGSQSA